ncbi:MAG: hypothetical protein D8M57_15535 [Candidatus Scalindua sp. AMX11]|nr:MAG: hypothetical protein DWQ00_05985 [Candidatus Scalindua sp.]NOG82549.1 hypothetical protein [Planctomycetota bacterium]RZV93978.1 MAG: hypothetical protein EX341_03745 [Candidatus Scalindua sp. SCAELEC01]TDE63979.1 MAG: hypothetical protein D8M57_15535 [Candidatus Scalindua sp. AMX11]GJQ57456.1 MAG: sulfotransferase [Candidatus Scalindua sp.]
MLPNFIIPGTIKGGTKALISYLTQHPDIFVFPREIYFFNNNYDKGTAWYEHKFDQRINERAVGEKTPGYMLYPECAKRIFDTIPDVKLIFLLRNPVNRTYSSYWMRRRKRKVPNNASFEKELSRRKDYLTHGLYADQISHYLEFFRKEQMMFVISEELHTNTKVVLRDICSFIGVAPDFEFGPISKDVVGRVPKNYFLTRIIKKMPESGLKSSLMKKLNTAERYPPMDSKTKEKLQGFFREPNKQLENIIERDLSEIWYP